MITLEELNEWGGQEGAFWVAGNAQYLDLVNDYKG